MSGLAGHVYRIGEPDTPWLWRVDQEPDGVMVEMGHCATRAEADAACDEALLRLRGGQLTIGQVAS